MSLQGLGNFDVSNSVSSYSTNNGVSGLGAQQQIVDASNICCSPEQFGNDPLAYGRYIKEWFSKCKAVTVYNSDGSVTSKFNNSVVFNVSVAYDNVPYIIIPAVNESVAGDYIVKIDELRNNNSSLARTNKILVSPISPSEDEKRELQSMSVEVLGISEMRDIDSSKYGTYRNNYAPNSFMDKLCRNIAYNYNAEHGTVGQNSGNSGLDSIGNAFSEGFNDIKSSLSGLFGRKNNNVANNPNNGINNPNNGTPVQNNNTQTDNNFSFGENLRRGR